MLRFLENRILFLEKLENDILLTVVIPGKPEKSLRVEFWKVMMVLIINET